MRSREPRVVCAIAVAFLTALFARSICTFRSREPRVLGAASAAFSSAAAALLSAVFRSREPRVVRVAAFVFVLFMALSSAETGPNRKRVDRYRLLYRSSRTVRKVVELIRIELTTS